MDNALRTWLEKNKVTSINLKKGGESVYTTDGDNPDDIADQLGSIYDGLPSGSYRLLGREKTGTNWANAQAYIFEKKGTNPVQNTTPSGMYTQEQYQMALELERKKWEFERLLEVFNETKEMVKKHDEILKKLIPAVENLLDDDPENDKSGLEKLSEMAETAKNLFPDLKLV